MSSEVRQAWWSRPLGHLLWLVITLVCMTLRKRVRGDVERLRTRQAIIALWHNRIFTPCYLYRYTLRGRVTMSMLASASKDGATLAAVAEDYGMRSVRGSAHRRGAVGFLDMLRELHQGVSMCITPDGPKGPLYCCHPGIIKLASMSGVGILPLRLHYSCAIRVCSWDHFYIPLPFSRIVLEVMDELIVPPELTSDELAGYCRRLEALMRDEDAVLRCPA